MAKIIINIPDAQDTRVFRSFAKHHGWTPKLPTKYSTDVPQDNPESAKQFTERRLRELLIEGVSKSEEEEAAQTARKLAADNVKTIPIT